MKMAGEFRDNALVDGAILHSDGYKYQGKVSYSSDGRILLGVNQTSEARAQRRGGDGPSIEMLGRAFLGVSLTEVAESVARDVREGRVSSSGQSSSQSTAASRRGTWMCRAEGPYLRVWVSKNKPTRSAAESEAKLKCNDHPSAKGTCHIAYCKLED